jgi:preprotein translocase subunit SecY
MDPHGRRRDRLTAKTPTLLTLVFFATWILGYGGFLYVMLWLSAFAEVAEALARLPIELPVMTERLLDLRSFLATMTGKLIAGGVGFTSFLPFVLGARRGIGTIVYAALTAIACLAFLALYVGIWVPAQEHAEQIQSALPAVPSVR